MKKILDKAVKGGFDLATALALKSLIEINDGSSYIDSVIFSHDFLKAFFGESFSCIMTYDYDKNHKSKPFILENWQYHAQQLVLSTDRKKYLERFI